MSNRTRPRKGKLSRPPRKSRPVPEPVLPVVPQLVRKRCPVQIRELGNGPWGEIEIYETYLEASDSLLRLLSLPSQQTVWTFINYDEKQLFNLFIKSCPGSEELKALTNQKCWKRIGNHIRVFPDSGVVENLTPRARATIYRVLGQWEENPAHRHPMIFGSEDLAGCLAASEVPGGLADLVRRLSYREGGITLFSDFPLLLRQISHPALERRLLRILTRTKTLCLQLRLSRQTDIGELGRYWNVNGKLRSSFALINSIVQTDGCETLDVANLLPGPARERLYTYPSYVDVMVNGRAPDGVWSTVNFFNQTPLPIYADSPRSHEHLKQMCRQVEPPYRYGDVLMITLGDGLICHACVYIAGDIVYTKDSAGLFSPWVFSRLGDVYSYHARGGEGARVTGYRRVEVTD